MSENVLFGKVTKAGTVTILPPGIKEIWDEAERKKISINDIVKEVRKVRSEVYNEEYGKLIFHIHDCSRQGSGKNRKG